jgi:hypothetical protein
MPRTAKAYITVVLCTGAAVLLLAARSWNPTNLVPFFTLLGFVAISSTLKMRIPGIESTVSPNFVFLLVGMTVCSFSEVVALALVAALVQTLWTAKRPRLVQVAFSVAALVLSASAAFECSRLLLSASASHSPLVFAVLAGSIYLPLNTALVSAVIGLVSGKPFLEVGRACFQSVFPYFMGGMVFAGLVSNALPRVAVWNAAVALFPMVVLGYLYAQGSEKTAALATVQHDSMANEGLVEVRSYRPRR